jgi:hypothetical protein
MKWNQPFPPPPPPPPAGVVIPPTHTTSFQKLRATFKLKPFSGRPAEWRSFDEGLERCATIHGLGAVLAEDYDRTVLLGMHPEEAEEPRGRRRREWNGGTRIGMYYRR